MFTVDGTRHGCGIYCSEKKMTESGGGGCCRIEQKMEGNVAVKFIVEIYRWERNSGWCVYCRVVQIEGSVASVFTVERSSCERGMVVVFTVEKRMSARVGLCCLLKREEDGSEKGCGVYTVFTVEKRRW